MKTTIEVKGMKVNLFKSGNKVYVSFPEKEYGSTELGYVDLSDGGIVEKKNKGVYPWLKVKIGYDGIESIREAAKGMK